MQYLKVNSNTKLSKADQRGYMIAHFSLPAIETCPSAGACKIGCYATQGNYRYPSVVKSYRNNLELTKDVQSFMESMRLDLEAFERKALRAKLIPAVRIHTSGDFYSKEYLYAWIGLICMHPGIQFYAYTKQLPLVRKAPKPVNLTLIFSEGGIHDSSISLTDRHARVFSSRDELVQSGYDDASDDDTVAFLSESGKIGLLYHGAARRAWSTNTQAEVKTA